VSAFPGTGAAFAGYSTGLLTAIAGHRFVYATIVTVESFVDEHYGRQVAQLSSRPELHELRALLARCHADEITHRDEARSHAGDRAGAFARAWTNTVTNASRAAVCIARSV
jgi:3-demethoxyubiquinol 3-hydroxylase